MSGPVAAPESRVACERRKVTRVRQGQRPRRGSAVAREARRARATRRPVPRSRSASGAAPAVSAADLVGVDRGAETGGHGQLVHADHRHGRLSSRYDVALDPEDPSAEGAVAAAVFITGSAGNERVLSAVDEVAGRVPGVTVVRSEVGVGRDWQWRDGEGVRRA